MLRQITLIGTGSRLKTVHNKFKLSNIPHHQYIYDDNDRKFELNIFKKLCENEQKNIIFFCNYPKKLICDWSKFQSFILHGGTVPQYRGASVINWQILNGEPNVGISLLRFSESFDEGEVIKTASLSTEGMRTLDDLRPNIDSKFAELCLQVVDKNLNEITGEKQVGVARYWHKRTKIHMQFDPKHDSLQYLKRLFRSSEVHYRPYIVHGNLEIPLKNVGNEIEHSICGQPGHILRLKGKTFLILKEGAVEIEI